MLFHHLYDESLAQASYLLACQRSGEAIVVDPNLRTGAYLSIAAHHGVRVVHVVETHIHADFVSGSRALADAAGATLWVSGEGGVSWRYAFANAPNVRELRDGDTITLGDVTVQARHTPGHTPEHLTFLVTDAARATSPVGAITGDFLFVGDVGRPDLLERAVGVAGAADGSARELFHSLQKFATLPDHLQLWPGHGAGSACGKSLGSVPQTTLGYEKIGNWAFQIADEDEFVRAALAGQSEPPPYFARMKRINQGIEAIPQRQAKPAMGDAAALRRALRDRIATVIDLRPARDFIAAHIRGSISIPYNQSFAMWAGTVVPHDAELYLIGDKAEALAAARTLTSIGLGPTCSWFPLSILEDWRSSPMGLESMPEITLEQLRAGVVFDKVSAIDVRTDTEWNAGHIDGAIHIPLARLADSLDTLPAGLLAVHCQGGARSPIAASMISARTGREVSNVPAGYAEWERRRFSETIYRT